MDWLNLIKLPDLLKIQTRYWVGALLVSGAILFVPDSYAVMLGIDGVRGVIRSYIGIFFIVATAIVFVQSGAKIFKWIGKRWTHSKMMKLMKKRFSNLSTQEKQILCGYILGDTRT